MICPKTGPARGFPLIWLSGKVLAGPFWNARVLTGGFRQHEIRLRNVRGRPSLYNEEHV
jgi:hypothetical protein